MVDEQDCGSTADHDHSYVPDKAHLSACSEKIVAYIAEFVVFKLENSLQCEKCVSSLFGSENNKLCALISMKTLGGLVFPSDYYYYYYAK